MKNKSLTIIILLLTFISGGCQNSGKLSVLTDMPSRLKENSGLAYFSGNHCWVIEDSGNKDEIYAVDFKGKIVQKFKVKNAKNDDWEDLASDADGNLYVGDFGDNSLSRKELVIYKLPNPEKEKGDKIEAEKIKFSYEDTDQNVVMNNTEAFFHWGNSLYIITKNLTKSTLGTAFIYKVPDTKGTYKAKYVGEMETCSEFSVCSITAADISSDGQQIVLLSNGLLWHITDFEWDNFSGGQINRIDLGLRTQLEAVCFKNDSILLLADERSHARGGNLYEFNLSKH